MNFYSLILMIRQALTVKNNSKLKKVCLILISLFFHRTFVYSQVPIIVGAAPTLELGQITQWLNGIDQLYGIYDQVMNNIEMIEQQYEQMQFYIERAASWNFNEIRWDGDLDFRNEIRNATSQVNRQLTNIRKIRDSFTAKTVNIGGRSFSFASLCGINDGKNGGDLKSMIETAVDYYGNEFASACNAFAEEVPERDAIALWNKYGLYPANYKMVKSVEDKLNEKISYLIAGADNDIEEIQDIEKEKYAVIEQIMDMYGQDNLTETEALQLQGMLQMQNFNALKDLEKQLKEGMSYLAWLKVYEKQVEDARNQAKLQRLAEQEINTLPSFMY